MEHARARSLRERQAISHRRRGTSGPANVVGMLMAVLLGGATVYGIYLLLPDHMKPGARPVESQAPEEPAEPVTEAPTDPVSSINPPDTPPVPPPETESPAPAATESEPKPPAEPRLSPEQLQAQREESAAATLRLAYRMIQTNPDAAPRWFRKVTEEHPDTQAAAEAARWLEQHATK